MAVCAGEIIKIARKRKGMTQEELGNLLHVGKWTIQKYERGIVENLKAETLRNLFFHLDIMPWMLVFPELIDDEDGVRFFLDVSISPAVFYELSLEGQKKTIEYALDLSLATKYRRRLIGFPPPKE